MKSPQQRQRLDIRLLGAMPVLLQTEAAADCIADWSVRKLGEESGVSKIQRAPHPGPNAHRCAGRMVQFGAKIYF